MKGSIKKLSFKKIGAVYMAALALALAVMGCGAEGTSEGDSRKVVLNEVAHSVEYPDKNNTVKSP